MDPQHGGLKRSLGVVDIVGLGINGVVGGGIFFLLGKVSAVAGGWAWAVYVVCALLCFLIALCFAEMGSRYRSTGGAYLYALDAFGPFLGFLVGWIVWLSSILGWASVAVGLADMLPSLGVAALDTPWRRLGFVALFAFFLGWLNVRGTRVGVIANNIFSAAKMVPLAVFVVLGLFHLKGSPFAPAPHWGGFQGIRDVMLAVLFMYTGFEEMAVPAGETRDAQRAVPRALFIVLASATAVYLCVHLVAQGVFPGLAGSKETPLTDAAAEFLKNGVLLISVGSVISLLGTNASIAFTGPRSMYALSRDRFLPAIFSTVHPRWGTPAAAIVATTVFTVLLPLLDRLEMQRFKLDDLVKLSTLASVLQYIAACAALIVMRSKRDAPPAAFTVGGGLVVPVVALVLCVALLLCSKGEELRALGIGVGLGIPIYFARSLWSSRPT